MGVLKTILGTSVIPRIGYLGSGIFLFFLFLLDHFPFFFLHVVYFGIFGVIQFGVRRAKGRHIGRFFVS